MLRFITLGILMTALFRLGYHLRNPQTPETYALLALALLIGVAFALLIMSWTPHL
jgi:RsiW-degrading membrane proteinase PrsW (M82 family)